MRKSLEENSENHPVHPHQAQSERPFSDDSEGIFLQSSSGENVVAKNKQGENPYLKKKPWPTRRRTNCGGKSTLHMSQRCCHQVARVFSF